MMSYELYCLDADGACTDIRTLGASHDADAIEQVEVMQLRSKSELWERARLVAELPPCLCMLATLEADTLGTTWTIDGGRARHAQPKE